MAQDLRLDSQRWRAEVQQGRGRRSHSSIACDLKLTRSQFHIRIQGLINRDSIMAHPFPMRGQPIPTVGKLGRGQPIPITPCQAQPVTPRSQPIPTSSQLRRSLLITPRSQPIPTGSQLRRSRLRRSLPITPRSKPITTSQAQPITPRSKPVPTRSQQMKRLLTSQHHPIILLNNLPPTLILLGAKDNLSRCCRSGTMF